jgi:15-cis-phytoene synthase
VHALYGFCRYADEIVDDLGPAPVEDRTAALDALRSRFETDLRQGWSDHEVLAALVHTVRTLDIDPEAIDRFLRSMAMDLHVTRYETWDDLVVYMDGSAAVIGEMMLPVLEPLDPAAFGPARDLGIAFQLTNFLRDVGEDLARGRVYLPVEDLERFGADPWRREVTPEWIALMRFEISRARVLYGSADRGIELLPPRSAACVRTARVLYSRILERIEANDYDVFSMRARVSTPSKALTAVRCLAGTIGTRKP